MSTIEITRIEDVQVGESAGLALSDERSAARFWAKVQPTGFCWEWTAAKSEGYGNFHHPNGKKVGAHRVAYQTLVGTPPEGTELDHLCRNRACVNPDHLEPVTHLVNSQRGQVGKYNAIKTHCPQGHPYVDGNVKVSRIGQRHCRACEAARSARKVPCPACGKALSRSSLTHHRRTQHTESEA